MNKANLANQAIELLMIANNECDSMGLYKCRKELLPNIFLLNCDLPFVVKDGYILIQIDGANVEITPQIWTITALRIVKSLIMAGMSADVANILHIISDYLGYVFDITNRSIHRKSKINHRIDPLNTVIHC